MPIIDWPQPVSFQIVLISVSRAARRPVENFTTTLSSLSSTSGLNHWFLVLCKPLKKSTLSVEFLGIKG